MKPSQISSLLKNIIKDLGIDEQFYSMHGFCIGRTSDLIKFGYPIEEVKRLSRWRSNVVNKHCLSKNNTDGMSNFSGRCS